MKRTWLRSINCWLIRQFRPLLYLPVKIYPSVPLVKFLYRLDQPLIRYLLKDSGLLNSPQRLR